MEEKDLGPYLVSFVGMPIPEVVVGFQSMCRKQFEKTVLLQLAEREDNFRMLSQTEVTRPKRVNRDLPFADLEMYFASRLMEKVSLQLAGYALYIWPALQSGLSVVTYQYGDWVLFAEDIMGYRINKMHYEVLHNRLKAHYRYRDPDLFIYYKISENLAMKHFARQKGTEVSEQDYTKLRTILVALNKKAEDAEKAGKACITIEIADSALPTDIAMHFHEKLNSLGFR